jgi:hypothetical protein
MVTLHYEIMANDPWREEGEIRFYKYTTQMMMLAIMTGDWQRFVAYEDGRVLSLGTTNFVSKNR